MNEEPHVAVLHLISTLPQWEPTKPNPARSKIDHPTGSHMMYYHRTQYAVPAVPSVFSQPNVLHLCLIFSTPIRLFAPPSPRSVCIHFDPL